MTAELRKPSIFIGSSVERLDIAYAMQEHLEYTAEPTVWTQDIFKPSSYALADLERTARRFQFAIFVFAPDDIITMRGARSEAVRDNIIFEFGLFVGALGLARCFLLVPRNAEPLRLPSDLLGLAPLTYEPSRSDNNIVAALGPAANRVRRAIREQVAEKQPKTAPGEEFAAEHGPRPVTAQDYVLLWNSSRLREARNAVRILPASPYGQNDEEVAGHRALRQLFAFLESMADMVLSGDIDEGAARQTFEQPVRVLWPHMYTLMAPPNHADDWWKPLPKLAELHVHWAKPGTGD